jgi:hypothetical protein
MYIQRVATVYDPDLDSLPAEFRKVLTKQDAKAIRNGPKFFADLADSNSPNWLRKLLKNCSEAGHELQFLSSGDRPYRPYYRFFWQGEPAISLPRSRSLRADMPVFLREIYKLIGAFNENGFNMAGGLHPGDELEPLSKMGMWIEPGGKIDPTDAIPFLETFAGSQLCYLSDGGGAWLKAGQLSRVKNVEREVAKYFEALLKGTRI